MTSLAEVWCCQSRQERDADSEEHMGGRKRQSLISKTRSQKRNGDQVLALANKTRLLPKQSPTGLPTARYAAARAGHRHLVNLA